MLRRLGVLGGRLVIGKAEVTALSSQLWPALPLVPSPTATPEVHVNMPFLSNVHILSFQWDRFLGSIQLHQSLSFPWAAQQAGFFSPSTCAPCLQQRPGQYDKPLRASEMEAPSLWSPALHMQKPSWSEPEASGTQGPC